MSDEISFTVSREGLLAALAPERFARLERELTAAAAVLQATLPIGQVKAIGQLEVADGCRQLAAMLASMQACLDENAADRDRLAALEIENASLWRLIRERGSELISVSELLDAVVAAPSPPPRCAKEAADG